MIDEIKSLKELLDMGAISQEEFDAKKAEILAHPVGAIEPAARAESTSSQGAEEKSKIVAALLALFLGTLGIHKFYLGYSTEGIIMLLVTLVGSFFFFIGPLVMGVIALIEGIVYLIKSDSDFQEIYVRGHKGWF